MTYQRLNRLRRLVQIITLLGFVLIPILNGFGIHFFMGTLYSLSIGELDIVDPLMALQTILLTRDIYLPLVIAAGLPIAVALIFGRVFCSWMCPQNTLSEWVDWLQRKLFHRRWVKEHHFKYGRNPASFWFWLIFGFLLIATLIAGFPLLAYLSAPGIITSTLSQAVLGMGIGVEILLVVIILLIEAAIFRRFWCKYFCPVGAFLALFRTARTWRISFQPQACDCKPGTAPCYTVCPLHLAPKETESLYPYCINCGLCVAFCENAGKALVMSFNPAAGKTHPPTPGSGPSAAMDDSEPHPGGRGHLDPKGW